MAILALYNPAGGDRTAESFFKDHVLPFVASHGKQIPSSNVIATESPDHAGKVVVDFLEKAGADDTVTVILGSGDGTLHEIISHLSLSGSHALPPSRLHFALVPCGTANALYSSFFPASKEETDPVAYKLQSVKAWIDGVGAVPLTLAITTISSPPSARKAPRAAVSAVVTSTSLHAAILRDSEALRATMPGLERFKRAAEDNITKWSSAWVKLLPLSEAGVVQLYNPETHKFETHPDSSEEDSPIVDVDGPFAFFLSTVNVDRLEPEYVIAPIALREPPREPALDLVIVRPYRDPTIAEGNDNEEQRTQFAHKLGAVLQAAYQGGAHTDLRYSEAEESVGELIREGSGDYIVEYIRCGGWEWAPDSEDEEAHTLCVDGTIFQIEKEGRAVCAAAHPSETAGFMVHISADKIL